MLRVALAALVALAFPVSALATHPSWTLDRKLNLDGDRALERVTAFYDVSSDHKSERAEIAVVDRCGSRDVRRLLAAGTSLDRETILRSSALGRPGVLFSVQLTDGSSIARVVQLRAPRPGACPAPAAIFSYSTARPPFAPPDRLVVVGFRVDPGEYSAAYAGRELRLVEFYGRPRQLSTSAKRTSLFRYAPAKRRYVVFSTRLEPGGP